jgi:hypothetical protein
MRFRYFLATLLALIATAAWTSAQDVLLQRVAPTVIAGENVGFRVEGLRGNTPVGRIVVMVNGRWVEAELARGPMPLSTQ